MATTTNLVWDNNILGSPPKKTTRKRYKELVILGVEIANLLDKKGVVSDERCIFGRIMENLIERDK